MSNYKYFKIPRACCRCCFAFFLEALFVRHTGSSLLMLMLGMRVTALLALTSHDVVVGFWWLTSMRPPFQLSFSIDLALLRNSWCSTGQPLGLGLVGAPAAPCFNFLCDSIKRKMLN